MMTTMTMTMILVNQKAFYPCSLVVPLHMIRDECIHRTDYTSDDNYDVEDVGDYDNENIWCWFW